MQSHTALEVIEASAFDVDLVELLLEHRWNTNCDTADVSDCVELVLFLKVQTVQKLIEPSVLDL